MLKKLTFFCVTFSVITFFFFSAVFAQWTQSSAGIGTDKTVVSFDSLGNNFYAGTYDAGLYLSTNNGANWARTPLIAVQINALATNAGILYAGATNISGVGGVFRSTNNGTNWDNTLSGYSVFSLASKDNNIIAGTNGSGIFLSTNGGINWSSTSVTTGLVSAIKTMGTRIFAGVGNGGVYVSTNNGANWTQTSLNNKTVYAFTISGSNIFAGTQEGTVHISTDNGATWNLTGGLSGNFVLSLASAGSNIFAGVYASGFYHSTNNGANWVQKNDGLTPGATYIYALGVKNNFIYAGTLSFSLWRRNLTVLISDVRQISSAVPENYSLMQNYPNPFNPVTKINFSIPKSGNAVLKVFNSSGMEVETLVNQNLTAGTYSVDFGNSNLASGIYFYTLSAGGFKETKKMMLVK
ncbi:MAG: T9SS type A sorting domain-containing protein [Bacteroidetes bacterium]|nr:T9SS type A sorting domain-containing protein [Bacteroidota bacterium]